MSAETLAPLTRPTPPPSQPRSRYVGVDLARFTAIVGMMAAHLVGIKAMLPNTPDLEQAIGEAAELVTNGTAAALFAVLGGLSTVFATRRFLREGRLISAMGATALRGVILILIGFLLGMIESDIVVVLAYYGLAMIIIAPLVALRGWLLASIAAVLGLVGGWLNIHTRTSLQIFTEGQSVSFDLLFTDPAAAMRALLVTGEYPVVTWTVYLLVGILVGRAFVAATARGTLGRTAGKFAIWGAAVMVVAQIVSNWVLANLHGLGIRSVFGFTGEQLPGAIMHFNYGSPSGTQPWLQMIAVPHSGSIGDLLRTIGLSLAVIGLLIVLCDREGLAGRTPGRVLDIVRATGAAPLTIYTLHIIATGLLLTPYLRNPEIMLQGTIPWWVIGVGAFALQLGGALIIGAILSTTGKRGPLETLLSKLVGFVIRR